MTTQYLAEDIASEEGCKLTAYPDPDSGAAPWTIGYGHTGPEVREGLVWTEAQAQAALNSDIANCERLLDVYQPWWRGLDDVRQDVVVQMTYEMGLGGFEDFPHAIACMRASDWVGAHDAMLDSVWAREVPNRAEREARQMLTGVRSWA